MTTADPIVAYLMVRTDLESLGVGKGFAHSMHAGNHLTWQLAVTPLMEGKEIDERVLEWHREGGGFGTTFAVGGSNQMTIEKLQRVLEVAKQMGCLSGMVLDTSYPYHVSKEVMNLIDPQVHTLPPQRSGSGFCCFREEETAGWVLGPKSELEVLMRQFDLSPNTSF